MVNPTFLRGDFFVDLVARLLKGVLGFLYFFAARMR